MMRAKGLVWASLLSVLACVSAQTPGTTTSTAPAPSATSFNLTAVIGNLTARQDACNGYQLPSPYSNATYDTSFLGPYLSQVVGADNYTYHKFGPLSGSETNNTLVMLVGSTESSGVWTPDLLQILALDREVVTFDYPGVGAPSTTPSDQQTLDSISKSLVGFFNALGLSQPDLLGWSWGGTIALYLGAFYPNSVGNLVLVSTTSGGTGYYPGEYISANTSTPSADLNALLFPDTISGQDGLCELDAFQNIMPGQNLTASELQNQTTVINSAWANNTLTESLGNITAPTLLVGGELDVIVDFQSTLFLLENINQSILLSTNAAGHGLLFQDTENVAPTITEFLDYYDDYAETYYAYDYAG